MGTIQQVTSSLQEYVSSMWSTTSVERVEVHAFTGSTKVELGENKTCTPVLVRVTAPPRKQRTPVDVVAVLNISKTMQVRKVQVQEAMMAVVSKLDRYDRLSIVALDDEATVEMALTHMNKSTCVTARETITNIISNKSWSRNCGDNSSEYALQKVGLQIKKTVSEERLRCVMLLSCGEDQLNMNKWIAESRTHNFQFHTFDLGARHDAGRFRCLVDQERAGTYHYFVNTSTITHAFTEFVGNLKTVVATSVKVSLKAEAAAGFTISSVETGGHCGSGEHQIHIAHMHAGEQKSFIVYLQSASEVAVTTVENILSVNGKYQQGCSSSEKVLPCLLHGKEITMKKEVAEEVAAEVVRSMLVKEVKEIIVKEEIKVKTTEVQEQKTTTEVQEQKTTTETHQLILEKEWKKIQELAVYKEASSTTLVQHIEKDVTEMKKSEGRLHMMSWLSCHWWQRATTMSHYSYAFRSSSTSITTMTTAKGSDDDARWRQPCLWVVGVLFLVLMVILLGRLLYSRRRQPLPAVRSTALDVGKHPEWPAMKDGLDVVLRGAKEDRITSFFKEKGASSRDMHQQIDQYLYMAILYAAVLRARYDGTAAFSEKVVRSHAEMYIQAMLRKTKSGALPSLDVGSHEDMTKAMSQYLYSTIVQTEVLVTIHPPGPVIDEIERLREDNDILRKENDRLQKEIAELRKQRDICCRRADDCEQKVNPNYGWGKEI